MLDWMFRNDQWFARTWNILWRRRGKFTTAHHTALKRSDAASTAAPPARSSCKAPAQRQRAEQAPASVSCRLSRTMAGER
jgi:hypothetical protein